MLRWKLFIPMAVILTVLGLLGNYYWNASASKRNISALNNQAAAEVEVLGDQLSVNLKSGQALADLLFKLDSAQLKKIGADKEIVLRRSDYNTVEADLTQEIDLLVAQAVATNEYYEASKTLKGLAEEWGYEASMIIWQGSLVAEVGNNTHSYITLLPLKGVNP